MAVHLLETSYWLHKNDQLSIPMQPRALKDARDRKELVCPYWLFTCIIPRDLNCSTAAWQQRNKMQPIISSHFVFH